MSTLLSQSLGTNEMDLQSTEVSTGTTIMAVEYDGGVVVAADCRTTMGAFIASGMTDKIDKLTDKIHCCRSGSAADTQAISDIVKYRLELFQMENNEEPTVHAAAHIFKDICYNYREQLMAGIICAGWDKRNGGQVFCIPLGGMLSREPVSIGGSGSGYIYGFVDSTYRKDMTEAECVDFAVKAVTLAIMRDGSSGGSVRVAIINKDGCRRKIFLHNELPQFYED